MEVEVDLKVERVANNKGRKRRKKESKGENKGGRKGSQVEAMFVGCCGPWRKG